MEKEFLNDQEIPKKSKKMSKMPGMQKEVFGIQSPTKLKAVSNFKIQNVTVAEINKSENVQEEEGEEDEMDVDDSNIIHFIKLPVISHSIQNTLKYSHMKLYFFFKSTLPQSYWAKRGTQICFHKIY